MTGFTSGVGLTVTAEVVLAHPVDVCVKVNVAVPPDTPVTTPAFVTEATPGLSLTQVPPVVGDKVVVAGKQSDELPVISTTGMVLSTVTITGAVAVQPFAVVVLITV